jgi:enoyl-CoA hydratase
MNEGQTVHTELEDHVLTITMDRPEARNALSRRMLSELSVALDRLDNDLDCWVGVLQGEGPTFCAGADLKEALESRTGGGSDPTPKSDTPVSLFNRHRKPLIGCVEGHAYAGGLEILMVCDLIVASTNAQFALTEVKRGLLAIGGGLFRLPRRLPANLAMEMILTGAPVSAQLLFEHRFVNRLTEPGQARAAARELALQIAANSPVAVQAALEVAATAMAQRWRDEDGWSGQREPSRRVQSSQDLIEGLRAFNEKRPANWSGR